MKLGAGYSKINFYVFFKLRAFQTRRYLKVLIGTATNRQTMISVIICTFNRADSLRRVLKSLINQEGCADRNLWELLIIDNNSNDQTKEIVENFITNSSVCIRYIFEPRQGKTYALNTGITKSRGEILAFTDDDVIVDKRWVAAIIEASTTYPHKGFGGKVIPLWPDFIPQWIQPTGPFARQIVGGAIVAHGLGYGNKTREYGKGMWIPIGANMFFRREVFEKYGVFRTDMGPKGKILGTDEDCEIGFRLRTHGEKLLYYPKAIVYHPVDPRRLSQEYLLKYAWNAAIERTSRNIKDRNPTLMRQAVAVVKSMMELSKTVVKYCFCQDDPAVKMYYKSKLYGLSGRVYYYLLGRVYISRRDG